MKWVLFVQIDLSPSADAPVPGFAGALRRLGTCKGGAQTTKTHGERNHG